MKCKTSREKTELSQAAIFAIIIQFIADIPTLHQSVSVSSSSIFVIIFIFIDLLVQWYILM